MPNLSSFQHLTKKNINLGSVSFPEIPKILVSISSLGSYLCSQERPDRLANTIDTDPDFLAFCESLKTVVEVRYIPPSLPPTPAYALLNLFQSLFQVLNFSLIQKRNYKRQLLPQEEEEQMTSPNPIHCSFFSKKKVISSLLKGKSNE
jgi:hypothetical protein